MVSHQNPLLSAQNILPNQHENSPQGNGYIVNQSQPKPLILKEKWSRKHLELINSLPHLFDNSQFALVGNILSNLDDDDELVVEYDFSEKALDQKIDRVHGEGYQRVSGFIRRLCGYQYYHDIDIVNCHPTLLIKICEEYGIPHHKLLYYVRNRASVIKNDCTEFNLSPAQVKQAYLKVIYLGGCNYHSTFLEELKQEVRNISEHLWSLSHFASEREVAMKETDNGRWKASYVSYILQGEEYKVVQSAMQFLEHKGWKVGVYVYDGFMVQKRHGQNVKGALEDLNHHVHSKFHKLLSFIEKPMEPTMDDKQRLYQRSTICVKDGEKLNKRTIFSLLCTKQRELNRQPSKDNLKEFKNYAIPMMNTVFAHVTGDRSTIYENVYQQGCLRYESMDIRGFKEALSDWKFDIQVKLEEKKLTKAIVLPLVWLEHKLHLKYQMVDFYPLLPGLSNEALEPTILNLFRGIAVPPTEIYSEERMKEVEEKELKYFLDHLKAIWAKDDDDTYHYILFYLACTVAIPWRKLKTTLVLKSKPGAGKGIVVNIMKDILGTNHVSIPNSLDEVTTAQFASEDFATCLLLSLDEAFYGGSKKQKGMWKKLISEEYIMLEKKYAARRKVRANFNVIITSNEEKVVNLDIGQRRAFVCELDDKYSGIQDDEKKEHFDRIWSTSRQVISNYFHSLPLGNWNERHFRLNDTTRDQIEHSLSPELTFLKRCLEDPYHLCEAKVREFIIEDNQRKRYKVSDDGSEGRLEGVYLKGKIFELFKQDNVWNSRHHTENLFWKLWHRNIPSIKNNGNCGRVPTRTGRARTVTLPTMKVAREEFTKNTQIRFNE